MLADPRISREETYIGVVQQAELLNVKLPSYSESDGPDDLLERITAAVYRYHPDLIDPFMTGCCAGKVVWLSKFAIEMPDIGAGDDWQQDWDNTVQSLYVGASKVGVPQQRVSNWIAEVRRGSRQILCCVSGFRRPPYAGNKTVEK
jgi:hypothetical protein